MNTVEMVCISPHEYRQRQRSVGERFDVDDPDVPLLKALGRAELADDPGQYKTRDMTAGDHSAEYRTRDMSAGGINGTLHVKRKYTKRTAT